VATVMVAWFSNVLVRCVRVRVSTIRYGRCNIQVTPCRDEQLKDCSTNPFSDPAASLVRGGADGLSAVFDDRCFVSRRYATGYDARVRDLAAPVLVTKAGGAFEAGGCVRHTTRGWPADTKDAGVMATCDGYGEALEPQPMTLMPSRGSASRRLVNLAQRVSIWTCPVFGNGVVGDSSLPELMKCPNLTM
jgi:hypothetical protein